MPYLAADKLFLIDCNRQESVSDLQEPLNYGLTYVYY